MEKLANGRAHTKDLSNGDVKQMKPELTIARDTSLDRQGQRQHFSKNVYIELAAFSESIYERGE